MHDLVVYPLSRIFRTTEELEEPEIAEVVGNIPEWIQGTFLRAGPGVFDLENKNVQNGASLQLNHFVDGYSILSKFEIQGPHITFHKKFLESDAYKSAKMHGKPIVPEHGTKGHPDPSRGFFTRLLPTIVPPLTDNCNLCAYKFGDKLFALQETNFFQEFDPKTLKTCEKFDTLKLYGLNSMSCHPLEDENGILYNVGISLITGPKYNILRIPSPSSPNQTTQDILKKAKIITTIPSSWNSLISFNHSFAMTRNYIIIIEQPYVFVLSKIVGGILLNKNVCSNDWLEWRNDLKNNFLIIEKSTGKLVKTEFTSANPFCFFHVINAYEENQHIIIDIAIFPNPSAFQNMTIEKLRTGDFHEDNLSEGARFVLPMLNSKDVEKDVNLISTIKTTATAVKVGSKIVLRPEMMTQPGLEYPIINAKYFGKKYAYYYATGSVTNGIFRNSIVKVETADHELVRWRKSSSYYVGEPVFIPNPHPKGEDDGVLLSAVITSQRESDSDKEGFNGRDFLLILDARSMEEIGRAYIKAHLPQGVHGTFVPNHSSL